MFGKRSLRLAAVSAAVALPLGLVAASPASAAKAPKPTTAVVSVLHGIPGVVVDVYANDTLLINDFTPGSLKKIRVPGGTYDLEIFPADAPNSAGTAILQLTQAVENGKNYTVAAYLSATGSPSIQGFQNNIGSLPKPKNSKNAQGRITVRHLAAAPTVDIAVSGVVSTDLSPISNGESKQTTAKKGTYSVAALAGGVVALGPVPLKVRQGWNVIAYAWGAPGGYQVALQYVKLKAPKTPKK